MTNLNQQQKIYLTAAVLASLILAAILTILLPLLRQIKNSSQELDQQQQQAAVLAQNWEESKKSRQENETVAQGLKEIPPLLNQSETIKFIIALENIARATKNRHLINVLSEPKKSAPAAPPPQEGRQKPAPGNQESNQTQLQVSLWGAFPNLMKFLIYLENSDYWTNIQSLQLSRLDQPDIAPDEKLKGLAAGDVHAIIDLSILIQPNNEAEK